MEESAFRHRPNEKMRATGDARNANGPGTARAPRAGFGAPAESRGAQHTVWRVSTAACWRRAARRGRRPEHAGRVCSPDQLPVASTQLHRSRVLSPHRVGIAGSCRSGSGEINSDHQSP
jgi:hypothetical protein